MALLDQTQRRSSPIREKVEAGERLDLEDGLALLESDDLLELGELADLARRAARRHGRGLLRPEPLLEPDERLPREVQVLRLRRDAEAGARLHDRRPTSSSRTPSSKRGDRLHRDPHGQRREPARRLRLLRRHDPLAPRGAARRAPQVLHGLRDPPHDDALGPHARGGAARAARPPGSARSRAAAPRSSPTASGALVAPGKEHPDIWFHVHDTAHRLGIPTHCTMLYGHVETYEERVDHILRLRDQQDRTGGFLAFIPLAFHPENTVFERRGFASHDRRRRPQDARVLAPDARQRPEHQGLLDHDGDAAGAVALHFGANDVQGTVMREEIFHAAGASTGTEQKVDELVRFVREAGRIPVQRDTLYNEVDAASRRGRDPARPHLVRQHGAGLPPARRTTSRRSSASRPSSTGCCSPASSTSRRSRRSSTRATPTRCACCRGSASRPRARSTRSSS